MNNPLVCYNMYGPDAVMIDLVLRDFLDCYQSRHTSSYTYPDTQEVEGRDVIIIGFRLPFALLSRIASSASSLFVYSHNTVEVDTESERSRVWYSPNHRGFALLYRDLLRAKPTHNRILHSLVEEANAARIGQYTDKLRYGTMTDNPLLTRLEVDAALLGLRNLYVKLTSNLGDDDYISDYIYDGTLINEGYTALIRSARHDSNPITLNGVTGLASNVPSRLQEECARYLASESRTFGLAFTIRGHGRVWGKLVAHDSDPYLYASAFASLGGADVVAIRTSLKDIGLRLYRSSDSGLNPELARVSDAIEESGHMEDN